MSSETNVMAIRGFDVEDISKDTNVANDDVARLMYYLYCVLITIDEIESNATTRRLSDYRYEMSVVLCLSKIIVHCRSIDFSQVLCLNIR